MARRRRLHPWRLRPSSRGNGSIFRCPEDISNRHDSGHRSRLATTHGCGRHRALQDSNTRNILFELRISRTIPNAQGPAMRPGAVALPAVEGAALLRRKLTPVVIER
jgi:hypothetical protein